MDYKSILKYILEKDFSELKNFKDVLNEAFIS